jgi:capsular exopolysaccharide synthesis family protein
MELKRFFTLARRWVWLVILGVALGAAVGYFRSVSQTPVYQARTRFVILRAAQTTAESYYSTYLDNQQLVETYVQLLTTDKVLDAASAELGYPVYAGQATAQQVPNTQFVTLTVSDTNPEHAAAIANVMVDVLIQQNEELQAIRYITSENNIQSQIDQVESQISDLQNQINVISEATVQGQLQQVQAQIDILQTEVTELQTQIADLRTRLQTSERVAEIAEKEARLAQLEPVLALYQEVYTNLVVLGQPVSDSISTSSKLEQLQTTLNLYQGIYINRLNSLEAVRLARVQNTPNVIRVEPALVPVSPVSPRPFQSTALAAAIGFMLAAGIAFLIEYLDDTIKTMEDVERILQLPVVGYIAQIQYDPDSEEGIYVTRQPRSPVSEAFRLLRTNLEFAGVDHPIRRLLVTSAGPGEGKTTVTVNLAAMLAQGGKRVMVVDADLRRPKVHRFLGLSNKVGLSDLFRGVDSNKLVSQSTEELESFSVITSGSLPPNPTELLASARMEQILVEAERKADVVVIDSPPSLVADVQVLAGKVDGVIMIIHPGHTQADAAQATLEMLNRAGARVIGVVLNRIPRDRAHYYGGYRHYSPYYSGYHYYSGVENQKSTDSSRLYRLFRRIYPFNTNGHKDATEDDRKEVGESRQAKH